MSSLNLYKKGDYANCKEDGIGDKVETTVTINDKGGFTEFTITLPA